MANGMLPSCAAKFITDFGWLAGFPQMSFWNNKTVDKVYDVIIVVDVITLLMKSILNCASMIFQGATIDDFLTGATSLNDALSRLTVLPAEANMQFDKRLVELQPCEVYPGQTGSF